MSYRVYTGSDEIGSEVGVALKNAIAVASGVLSGLGYGDNTRAALMTRGLAEMIRFGTAMGGKPENQPELVPEADVEKALPSGDFDTLYLRELIKIGGFLTLGGANAASDEDDE